MFFDYEPVRTLRSSSTHLLAVNFADNVSQAALRGGCLEQSHIQYVYE